MKFDLNTANDGATAKASPFHALIVLGKNNCPYILAICMANLSKFHVVFSSSNHIRLDKDAVEGHLCQTVNNFVKQNKSSLPSLLRKRRPPQGCDTTRRPQGWWCSFYYIAPFAWNNLPDSVVVGHYQYIQETFGQPLERSCTEVQLPRNHTKHAP